MATPRESPKLVALTRVHAERAKEFEQLIPVLAAAQEQARPHLNSRWQLLRPDTETNSNDATVYLFLFYGDAPLDEWDIENLCIEALGDEEGRRLAQQVLDCLDGEQEVYAFSGDVAAS